MAAYQRAAGAHLTAVADNDAGRAGAAARDHGAEPFTDAVALLDSGLVDAISVVSPGPTHVAIATEAGRRGIGVLLEKPVALTLADAVLLRSVAAESVLTPAHVLRFADPYIELRRRVRAGEFGQVLGIVADRHRTQDHRTFFGDVGLPLMTTVHDIDLAIWLTGSTPASVRARTGRRGAYPVDAAITAAVGLTDGSFWTFNTSWLLHDDQPAVPDRFQLFGTLGTATVSVEPADDEVFSDAMDAQIAHFLDCVTRRSRSEIVPLGDAFTGIALAEAMASSVANDAEVAL